MDERTCRRCGDQFTVHSTRGRKRFLCYGCSPAAAPRPPRTSRCEMCGLTFEFSGGKQRYCRIECRRQAERNAAVRRPPIGQRPRCIICGGPVISRLPQAVVCSQTCKVRRDSAKRVRTAEQLERKREAQRRYREAHPEKFNVWTDARRAAYHRRRARKKAGDAGERIVHREVFKRDGWVCGICGRRVNPDLVFPHPKSSSLDHIVPLSKGGTHTMANVQLAHLACNTAKRDNVGGAGDQLRLIG